MNKFVLITVFCCFFNVNVNAQKIFPYLVSFEVEKSIYKYIENRGDTDVVFVFQNISDNIFKIHLLRNVDNDLKLSDRKIFVNDTFYPLIFYTDFIFFTELENSKPIVTYEKVKSNDSIIEIPSIEIREKDIHNYGYKRNAFIIDNSIYWIIDSKGKLIETNSE